MATWMVVEDEPGIYDVLLAMFELWGIEGAAFVDGEEAIAWIDDLDKASDTVERPELALLDIRLPGSVSGAMVAERLRKSNFLRPMAIVLMTAYKLSVDEEQEVLAQSGADRLVYKPLPKFHELKRLLEDVIEARRITTPDYYASLTSTPTPTTNPISSSAMHQDPLPTPPPSGAPSQEK